MISMTSTSERTRPTERQRLEETARKSMLLWYIDTIETLRHAQGIAWAQDINSMLRALPSPLEEALLLGKQPLRDRVQATLRLMLLEKSPEVIYRVAIELSNDIRHGHVNAVDAYAAACELIHFAPQILMNTSAESLHEATRDMQQRALPLQRYGVPPTDCTDVDEICAHVAQSLRNVPLRTRIALLGVLGHPKLQMRLIELTERDAAEFMEQQRERPSCQQCDYINAASLQPTLSECMHCDPETTRVIAEWLHKRGDRRRYRINPRRRHH